MSVSRLGVSLEEEEEKKDITRDMQNKKKPKVGHFTVVKGC